MNQSFGFKKGSFVIRGPLINTPFVCLPCPPLCGLFLLRERRRRTFLLHEKEQILLPDNTCSLLLNIQNEFILLLQERNRSN